MSTDVETDVYFTISIVTVFLPFCGLKIRFDHWSYIYQLDTTTTVLLQYFLKWSLNLMFQYENLCVDCSS